MEAITTTKTIVLVRDDCQSTADGYHLDVWQGILDNYSLPPDTDWIELKAVRFDQDKE